MKKIIFSFLGAILALGIFYGCDRQSEQASTDEIKIGVILGFTGPIESLTPTMASSAELAMKEVSDSGLLLGGASVSSVRADSTCVDAGAATSAAERLVTSDNVAAIMGADCSGAVSYTHLTLPTNREV